MPLPKSFLPLPNSLLPLPNRPRQGQSCIRPCFMVSLSNMNLSSISGVRNDDGGQGRVRDYVRTVQTNRPRGGLSWTVSRDCSQLSQSRPCRLHILRRLRVCQEKTGSVVEWLRPHHGSHGVSIYKTKLVDLSHFLLGT